MDVTSLLQSISDHLWEGLAYGALALGLLFSILFKFTQVRRIPDMVRLIAGKGLARKPRTTEHTDTPAASRAESAIPTTEDDDGGVSSFQALALTLSSRVGVGAIAGVATAIAAGGPGAIFWMAVTGLLGAASSYAESVLAQVYKRRIDGEHRGGIPYYIKFGLGWGPVAVIAAIIAFVGYGFLFPGIQSNNISSSVQHAFGIEPWITATVVSAILAFVIIGGTQRIVNVAQMVIPFMAGGYILVALIVILVNFARIPDALVLIFSSAFGAHEIFGGIFGYAVAWGVRRAIFTSVAGIGEGTYGAAAARVSHPSKQGLVQAFSIYIDVLFVCMATGLLIVVTDSYDVILSTGEVVKQSLTAGIQAGPEYAQIAIDAMIPGFGSPFVAVAIFLFAFTSQIAFYYIATSNLLFLTHQRTNATAMWILKIGALAISFFGGVVPAQAMWAAGDIGYATLGWVNMFCILMLLPVVIKVHRDFERQRKLGIEPVFHPEDLGIANADFWLNPSLTTPIPVGERREPRD
ncbi:alanine/glycine:cation symporter family protein [Leucobacter tardus]|uniref:Alanine:cation symporter family protein n=1 Tax=Leucobacter tardus TaxID=501483 RepID=A0A939QE26_9MICO|nr:alanine/glycine:cation symporter family protein [Leucobacter tardus]MBO2989170.1 alanine:cation symporter family protein [Leucobacter tardus]